MTKKNIKSIILKALLVAVIIAAIAGISYLILYSLGFTTVEKFEELKASLGDSFLFWAIVSLLQAFQVVFIPISNQIITIPIALLFNNELWKVFLSSWSGITIGSIALYFIGKYGGHRVLSWILSDKEKASELTNKLRTKRMFYPIGMLIPIIPDDLLTTLTGMCGFGFVYVLVIVIITRGICVAASTWGFGYLTKFWWGWVILGIGLVLLILATILLGKLQGKKEEENGNK